MALLNKYVPILKWKAAEITALTEVAEEHRKRITPLIEIVLPGISNVYKDKEKTIKKTDEEIHGEMLARMTGQRFTKIPEEIEKAWGTRKIYVDTTLLHNKGKSNELKIDTMSAILDGGKKRGLELIPVLNLADDASIVENISRLISNGEIKEVCVRVTPSNLKDIVALNHSLPEFLRKLGIGKSGAHLLVDLKYVDSTSGTYTTLFAQTQNIIGLKDFQEFIFASGAFPVDMTECSFEDPTYLPRTDWTSWKSNAISAGLVRVPVYGDYSIRHPLYNESLQLFESSSTLKYTVGSHWMILRGKKRALHMYLTSASLLVQQPEFNQATSGMGAEFSFGDGYIVKKAKHFDDVFRHDNSVKGTGRTQDWIAAGVSHHIGVVMHQLSNPRD
jgi:hypothetical protein